MATKERENQRKGVMPLQKQNETGRFQKVCRGQQITIPVIDTQNIAKKLLFWTKALLNASLLKQSKVQYSKRRFIVVLF